MDFYLLIKLVEQQRRQGCRVIHLQAAVQPGLLVLHEVYGAAISLKTKESHAFTAMTLERIPRAYPSKNSRVSV